VSGAVRWGYSLLRSVAISLLRPPGYLALILVLALIGPGSAFYVIPIFPVLPWQVSRVRKCAISFSASGGARGLPGGQRYSAVVSPNRRPFVWIAYGDVNG
jgi:hypothetical protein